LNRDARRSKSASERKRRCKIGVKKKIEAHIRKKEIL
jgi:hypothetical protein